MTVLIVHPEATIRLRLLTSINYGMHDFKAIARYYRAWICGGAFGSATVHMEAVCPPA